MDRRQFMQLSAALLAANCLPRKKEYVESADLPTLGGAPDTPEGHTIAAFVDTVVPGRHRDPLDVVGGIDVGAPGRFFEEGSQVSTLVPLLVLVLDSYAHKANGTGYAGLKPSQREEVLETATKAIPEIDFAVQLAKVSYYSAPETAAYLKYPGANWGYQNDENFSFRRQIGNPLQIVVDNAGNYP